MPSQDAVDSEGHRYLIPYVFPGLNNTMSLSVTFKMLYDLTIQFLFLLFVCLCSSLF